TNRTDETLPSSTPREPQSPRDPDDEETLASPAQTVSPSSVAQASITDADLIVGDPQTMPVSGNRPETIGWDIAGLTDVGLKRKLNEDNLILLESEIPGMGPTGLYVVADGMGGHEGGEIASRLTIETIQTEFDVRLPIAEANPFDGWLKAAVSSANKVVMDHQKDMSGEKKMGSTLIMALVADGQAHIANVGDSRAYRLTQDSIEQISVDHSLVERLIQIGQITREEARTHKQRNVIYSTIGDKEKFDIGFYHIDLNPGERLLLCSDGLSGMITDEEILAISQDNPSSADASKALVAAAKSAGGTDNITAIIVEMKPT
ncbi:MAG: Stp1/IreP family PP2C-type Ser/Thr phosphatase, partial [Chloroflexota bacterium]